jgi:hypothetical protein
MKWLFLLFIPCFASAQHLEFKGWAETTRELSTRMTVAGEDLPFYSYLPAEGMEGLMGTWENYGSVHRFRNGTPNPMNMMLWYYTLSSFSQTLAASCKTKTVELNARFQKALNRICAWPVADAKSDDAMLDFWFGVMGYNAPEEEFVLWRDFFRTSSYQSKTGPVVVEAMTLAIVMNPYFLLKQ